MQHSTHADTFLAGQNGSLNFEPWVDLIVWVTSYEFDQQRGLFTSLDGCLDKAKCTGVACHSLFGGARKP
jgi:hypothetical protein